MATTTANMALSKPALGGDSGVWDDFLNDSIDLIDLHDHASGKGVRIGAAGLNLITDVSLNGTGALTNVKAVAFTAQASYATNSSIFVDSDDSELYWRNASGTDVQITSGTSLNLSLVGGITGDYAAAGAEFYYDDAAKSYRALQDTPLPNVWASISAGDVDLYEKASGITNRVRLSSPATLAASYALTLPSALPATSSLLQVSTGGAISYNVTGTRSPGFLTTLDCNSTVSLGTAVAAFTATAVITATDFKHSTARVQHIPPVAVMFLASGVTRSADLSYVDLSTITTDPGCAWPVVLDEGMRIDSIAGRVNKTSPAGTVTARLRKYTVGTGVIATNGSATNSANNPGKVTLTITPTTETITSDEYFWVEVVGGGTAGDLVEGIAVSYTRP